MQEPGPFEHVLQTDASPSRDRAAAVIVAAGIVLGLLMLLLVLPPISILDTGGDSDNVSGPVTATARDEMPAVPAGYEAVSALYDLESTEPVNRPATVGVPLTSTQPSTEELYLYTYEGDQWHEVGTATVVAEGEAASGDVNPLPANVAVFKQGGTALSISGGLPAGGELDEQALGVLATLNPQGYTLASDGSIAGSLPPLPENLGVALAPTIIATDAGILGGVLSSNEGRDAHTNAIVTLVGENNYVGIDLDYRVMDPQDGDDFVTLVGSLGEQLRQDGRTLTLILPPPVNEGADWNTFGFDWDQLAPLVDSIKVAPADPETGYETLEDALAYLVPRVGSSKLFVTVESLSRERGSEGTRLLRLTDALTLASVPAVDGGTTTTAGATVSASAQNLSEQSGGSLLRWDGAAKAVMFTYTGGGGERSVWLANAFSESFKLELAQRFQLGGVAIEDVSRGAGDSGVALTVGDFASSGILDLVEPNGQLLEPQWTASGGALSSDSGAGVSWEVPNEPGDYTLTLIVSDGVVRLGQEVRLAVDSQ